MRYRVVWTKPAARDMKRLDQATLRRIAAAVSRLAESGQGDVKRLHGPLGDEMRLRVGDWRVRLTLATEAKELRVLRVLHRGRAYGD